MGSARREVRVPSGSRVGKSVDLCCFLTGSCLKIVPVPVTICAIVSWSTTYRTTHTKYVYLLFNLNGDR